MANTWQIHEFEGDVTVRQFEADSVRVFWDVHVVLCSCEMDRVRLDKTSDFKTSGLHREPLEAPVCHR